MIDPFLGPAVTAAAQTLGNSAAKLLLPSDAPHLGDAGDRRAVYERFSHTVTELLSLCAHSAAVLRPLLTTMPVTRSRLPDRMLAAQTAVMKAAWDMRLVASPPVMVAAVELAEQLGALQALVGGRQGDQFAEAHARVSTAHADFIDACRSDLLPPPSRLHRLRRWRARRAASS